MSLTQGTRLASYEIIGPLGAGGMGEVYRARDTKLDRDVAIKVLPDLFAADPDRLARFAREAKTLAAVNHPNIAQVHGVIEQPPALVMELVEGEDLAQLLARGPIPLDQALPIARQIAEALEAAHERGIIHRDLKPANIKVRDDGTVKVLDFGLAKALVPEGVGVAADVMNSPTLTSPMTQMGMILGTAAYMAPEQAKGKPIDKRADIWAFGCVLYEMLTGRRAFDGESITDVLSAVTRDEPRWTELPSSTPASMRRLLQRCLEKDPRRRLRDIGDARIELESPGNDNAERTSKPKSDIRRVPLWILAAGILVTALAASVMTAAWARARFSAPAAFPGITGRAAIQVPGLGDIRSSSASLIAMSPDGALLIYGTTVRAGSGNLRARRLDSLDSQPIEGTVGAQAAFLSHDGRLVGFQREGEIFTVAVSGGPVTRLKGSAHLPEGRPAWTPDGRIVYTGPRGELLMLRTDGSQPEKLTQPERGERHLSPHVLPDGRTALFTTVGTDVNQARIAAISLTDRQVRTLVADGAMTAQYADGFLFYVRPDRTLMAAPFDAARVELSGDPVALPDRVNRTRFGVAHYAAAAHVLVYVPSSRTRLVEVDRGGRSQTLVAEERSWHHPRYSPDGTRIVMDLTFGGIDRDVWMFDRGAKTLSRITRIGDAHDPSWLPDGKDVSFFSFKSPDGPLMLAASDGASEPRPIRIGRGFAPADLVNPGRWLPDGSAFLGGVKDAGAPSDIWRIPRDGSEPQKLVSSSYDELAPAVSRNGRWLAYQSDETGRPEVYVRAVNGPEGRVQVSNTGGTEPVWDPSADVLYYVEADGDRRHIVAATLRTAPKLAIDARTVMLSAIRLDESDNHPNYDIHPSGKTFVMPELEASAGLVAIFDWVASVRDQAASRRQSR